MTKNLTLEIYKNFTAKGCTGHSTLYVLKVCQNKYWNHNSGNWWHCLWSPAAEIVVSSTYTKAEVKIASSEKKIILTHHCNQIEKILWLPDNWQNLYYKIFSSSPLQYTSVTLLRTRKYLVIQQIRWFRPVRWWKCTFFMDKNSIIVVASDPAWLILNCATSKTREAIVASLIFCHHYYH